MLRNVDEIDLHRLQRQPRLVLTMRFETVGHVLQLDDELLVHRLLFRQRRFQRVNRG
jgi:hypothetical protein